MAYSGMQVNGSMEVSQEIPTATIPSGNVSPYIVDGWMIEKHGTSVLNAGQIAGGPLGFKNSIQLNATTPQPTIGTDYVWFKTFIEGYRISRLALGTASASPFTVGFWARMTLTGTYRAVAFSEGGSGNSGWIPFTINASMVWQWITLTVPAQTTGTWRSDNGVGITLVIDVASSGVPNTVGATGQYAAITGVVVLPGIESPSAARSPLIMRPYDQELLTCQRYWQRTYVFNRFVAGGAQTHDVTVKFSVPFRSTPTVALLAGGTRANVGSTIVDLAAPEGTCRHSITAAGAGDTYALGDIISADARL